MPAISSVALRPLVLLLALQPVGRVPQVLDRLLELLADVVVGRDARRQRDRTAAAEQLVVELLRGDERAHHVVA